MKKRKHKFLAVMLGLSILMGSGSFTALAQNDGQMLENLTAAQQQESQESLDYILGRPMTEEEKREQEAMMPELHEMPMPDEVAEPVLNQEQRARTAQYPETYDLRQEGLVTSVKNQVVNGACWAFAAIAMAESGLLKQGIDGEADLSEEHLAYFFYNRVNDPLGNTSGDKNVANDPACNYKTIGGNLQLASKFLSTWSGVVREEAAPYAGSAPIVLDESLAYESELHLQNARFIYPSVDEIKEAIYANQQPVGITYYHSTAYWNTETAAYCCPMARAINHAVTIVGWDDTYKKENFPLASNVTSDGAWIVKNNWGEASGKDGYLYISYEDKSISGLVSAEFEPADNYDHNYQYDGSSGSSSVSVPHGASYANVFQVNGNPDGYEILKAVGILTVSADTQMLVDVYTNLTDSADPLSGEHVISGQQVSADYSGYYTFPLQQEVKLQEESRFSVIFTNCSGVAKSFSIESTTENTTDWILFKAEVVSGQSFYRSKEGTDWKDMNGDYLSKGKSVNARIKAYTVDAEGYVPVTPSETAAASLSPAPTGTEEASPSPTSTGIEEATPSPTSTGIEKATPSPTSTGIEEATPSPTSTGTEEATPSPTSTGTEEATPSPISTGTEEATASPTSTRTAEASPSPTPATGLPTLTPPLVITETPRADSLGKVSVSKVTATAKAVTVKWKKVSGALKYQVYRAPAGKNGKWSCLGTTKKTSYVDKSVQAAKAYRYRVRAVKGSGASLSYGLYSSIQKVLTKPLAPAKASVKRTTKVSTNTKVQLTLKASARATGYEIYQFNRKTSKYQIAYKIDGTKVYRYQKSTKKYIKIGKVKKQGGKLVCTLTKIDLKTYGRQYFKVRACVKKSGYGTKYSIFTSKMILKR